MRYSQFFWIIAIVLLSSVSGALNLIGDWLWFVSMGYGSLFANIIQAALAIGLVSFLAFFSVTSLNVLIARKLALGKKKKKGGRLKIGIVLLAAALISLAAAAGMGSSWETVLKYMNSSQFGTADPIFGMDVGFYVFSLPFYGLVLGFLGAVLVVSAALSLITFLVHSGSIKMENSSEIEFFFSQSGSKSMKFSMGDAFDRLIPHLSALLFFIFMIASAAIWFARYGLLFSTEGAVVGAGYTAVNIMLPLMNLLSAVALITGFMFLANIKLGRPKFIVYLLAAFFIISVIGLGVSGAVQGLVVQPDEFNLEKPYLERSIDNTLAAYDMTSISEEIFPINYSLTSEDINNNAATIGNIRLWDWRPLKQTYEQLQLFRTYYDFNDVDIDRYEIDGMYRQVLVSAREMNTRDLQSQAQTWVNRHLVYTHGYGAVMNPVDRVSEEGLPVFYVKDIPPVSDKIQITQPRIYFGEKTTDYVITGTSTDEFDYPSGDENIYTSYEGTSGVALDNIFTKLVYASKLGSVELLVSGSLTDESRLLLNRQISDRADTILPFLLYDSDPYLVISEGRLFWILDAYTTTNMYPYSESVGIGMMKNINYIRNSVKVVIDAYNGDVSYYVIDSEDPIIKTYMKMFPEVFSDIAEMPDGIRSHLRYPEVMFSIQAYIYSTYHMKDPRVFYNREDVWVTPDELYRGSRQKMLPYYITMRLPGEDREEFILMIPFTPKDKENLVGWMAARSDPPNYGKILVYQFSKQELTYGPMQIEARIDQDTDISQLITLWSQSGSSVLRGNTLVIPIENSIMYVEPLYLEATEKGTLPQLQRVIVSYGSRLTMQETLSEALDVIFGEGASSGQAPGDGGDEPISRTDAEKLSRIAELYDKAQEALSEGNLGQYQDYIEQIGELAS